MIHPYSSSIPFSPLLAIDVSFSGSKSDCFFKNQQGWQISRHLDLTTGSPTFHLIDTYGISCAISEFVVEDLDPDFTIGFVQLTTQEQLHYVYQYLQKCLSQATPYQVHIERYHNKYFIRFGDHGLKGGGRVGAFLVSLCQIILGVGLNSTSLAPLSGDALITSGISGGIYAFQRRGVNYEDLEYAKQACYGLIAGLISAGIAKIAENSRTIVRISCQALGVALGHTAAMTTSSLVEKKRLPDTITVIKKSTVMGIGAGTGAVASHVVEYLIPSLVIARMPLLIDAGAEIMASAGVVTLAAIHILRKSVQGSIATASGKAMTNWCEGKNLSEELIQSAFIGGVINGGIASINKIAMRSKEHRFREKWLESRQEMLKVLELQESDFEEFVFKELTRQNPQVPVSKLRKSFDAPCSEEFRFLVEFDILNNLAEFWITMLKKELKLPPGNVTAEDLYYLPEVQRKAFAQLLESVGPILKDFNHIINQKVLITTIPEVLSQATERSLHLFHPNRLGVILEDALKTESVTFVEAPCTMKKLIPHVVLVQALEDSTYCHYPETDYIRIEQDQDYKAICCIKGVITPDGCIGHHLNLDKRQYKESMTDRPHLHWAWNQLVQPNSGGNWEASKIAILEPLATFENSINSLPFGIAPL